MFVVVVAVTLLKLPKNRKHNDCSSQERLHDESKGSLQGRLMLHVSRTLEKSKLSGTCNIKKIILLCIQVKSAIIFLLVHT